jgi:hypothetical protein
MRERTRGHGKGTLLPRMHDPARTYTRQSLQGVVFDYAGNKEALTGLKIG